MYSRVALSLIPALIAIAFFAPGAEAEETAAVAQAAYRQISLTGFTRSRASLPLVAESTGKVLEVDADIGGSIGEDGIFARLDPTFIRLDLEANRVQQAQFRSRIDYNQRETKRYRKLLGKGSASESRMDELEQTLRDSRHQLAELEVREKTLLQRLERTQVKAPAGWLLTRRTIESGQRVNEGEVLGEVADFSQLLIPFALSPAQYAALSKPQDNLHVRLPDWNLRLKASIYRVYPDFDQETRKIAVELMLEEEPPVQRGGLRVRLTLDLPERTGAVLLPAAAVESSYDEFWVTRQNGERVQVVRLGVHSGENENPGNRLLRVAAPGLKPGDAFRLINKE